MEFRVCDLGLRARIFGVGSIVSGFQRFRGFGIQGFGVQGLGEDVANQEKAQEPPKPTSSAKLRLSCR